MSTEATSSRQAAPFLINPWHGWVRPENERGQAQHVTAVFPTERRFLGLLWAPWTLKSGSLSGAFVVSLLRKDTARPSVCLSGCRQSVRPGSSVSVLQVSVKTLPVRLCVWLAVVSSVWLSQVCLSWICWPFSNQAFWI